MEFNYKAGDKLEVVQEVGGLKIGDIVTVKRDNDNTSDNAYTVTDVTRESDGFYFGGCYAKRFKKLTATPVLDFTKPVQTKDGKPVTLVTTNGRGEYPVLAYVGSNTNITKFTADGNYFLDKTPSCVDLENVPPPPLERTLYVNINKVNGSLNRGGTYDSRAYADRNAHTNRVGCMKITLVEGQFDE